MLFCERGEVETKIVPIPRRSAKTRDVRVVFRFTRVKVDPAIPRLVKAYIRIFDSRFWERERKIVVFNYHLNGGSVFGIIFTLVEQHTPAWASLLVGARHYILLAAINFRDLHLF